MLNFFPCVTLTKGDTAAWPRASRANVRAHWIGFPAVTTPSSSRPSSGRAKDRGPRVRARHRVDAALDRAVAAPDEQNVSPLGRGPARVLGGAALAHLV